tara:strand:- start:3640 stop:4413 length:774 start_codon:yes stop_codon:yes gene_type:complete
MIELPKTKLKADRINPQTMVIFSQPKMGKTTVISKLDNCLLLDFEDGSHFVDALKINVVEQAREDKKKPIVTLKHIINAIKEENEQTGEYVYKYIAVDTVTALEEIVLPLANNMYKATNMGRNWVGDDVTTLPNGAGYKYTRDALSHVLNELEQLCETLIILGHVKDRLIEREGKEMPERGLALTGKSSSILCSQVDAVGYLYRDNNKTIINFASSPNLLAGARCEHLKGQEIVIATSEPETTEITVDWTKIFLIEK